MKKLNKKGFTIVELVIVIAVIAILAGVLFPTFTIVVKKANQSACMQALDTARKEYMTEVDATSDDFADFDEAYAYNYTVAKKGADYDDLSGLWRYENGTWDKVPAADIASYGEDYRYEKATAFADGTTYYSDKTGTVASSVTDSATFDDYVGTLYTRAAAEVQGVAIYVKPLA